MTKRLTPERLQEIRSWLGDTPNPYIEGVQDLLSHIDALTVELAAARRVEDEAKHNHMTHVEQWREKAVAAEAALRDAREALEKSVSLQSHYAILLNHFDGGKRMIFGTAQKWLDRLKTLEGPGT